jgi:hypothetical protein
MHYIRCLRAPKVSWSGRTAILDLTFTVTTDLGDAFLFPDEPIGLTVNMHYTDDQQKRTWTLSDKQQLIWKGGQRVAKPSFRLPLAAANVLAAGCNAEVCISTCRQYSADGIADILEQKEEDDGLVMPAWLILNPQGDEDADASYRRLDFNGTGDANFVDIGEEIGESIARHIWDGGLVAACALNAAQFDVKKGPAQGSCVRAVREIVSESRSLNILELGCGVGILGMALARLCAALRSDANSDHECVLLMTDLEEAEQRARFNMARLATSPSQTLVYENLDWEDGRLGHFGEQVTARHWDLIMLSDCTYNVDMLPALVETLSSLHSLNAGHAINDGGQGGTKVFLATKPRHSSEQALFALMAEHQWAKEQEQTISLPVIGAEPQSVELYLFEKR